MTAATALSAKPGMTLANSPRQIAPGDKGGGGAALSKQSCRQATRNHVVAGPEQDGF